MDYNDFYVASSDQHKKKEKAKARELRNTNWWKAKLSQGICHYCENKFKADELTMDHVIPVARGGFSSKANIVAACKSCNTNKAHISPVESILRDLNIVQDEDSY